MNYPALPRSGLPAPRLLRTGLPVSVSELVPDVDTAVPDSAGDFPSQVVRSVPLLPRWTLGHNRRCALLVALEHRYRYTVAVAVTVRDVVSIVLSYSTVWVVNVPMNAQTNYAAVYPLPALTLFGR